MDNQQVTEAELGWLAGFIDGEGYLGLRLHTNANGNSQCGHFPIIRPELHVVNTDKAMIEKAASIAQRLDVNLYIRENSYGKESYKKDVFKAQTKGINKISRLLAPVLVYMTGDKQKRAEYIYKFCISRINAPTYKNPMGNGSGRVKPYSEQELEWFEYTQPLMRRGKGTSETLRNVLRRNTELMVKIKERNDRFLDAVKI